MVLLPSILASSVMYRSKTTSSLIHRSRLHVSSITFCFSSVVPFLSNFFSNAHNKNSLSSNLLRSVLSLKYSSGSIFFGCSTLKSLGISLTLTVKPSTKSQLLHNQIDCYALFSAAFRASHIRLSSISCIFSFSFLQFSSVRFSKNRDVE